MEEAPIPTEYVSYALANGTTRSEMLRNAIFANLLIKNQKKTCEERGIPPAIFKDAWDEYQHTAQYHQGRFFHSLELAAIPTAAVKNGCTQKI